MEMVKITELTKKYGDVIAVDNISLEIEEGEIFGLLGPNGAGKSTTINMITGLLSMDKGSIWVMGKDISVNSNEVKKNIGIVPQDIGIYEDLTSLENVMFFASLYGLRGKELKKRAEEALEFTGLAEHINSFPKKFSGGMKRRLNIACAIAHRPKLIIMDEPTVGIDPQSRKHILESVKLLNQLGSTIIYTSHYMEEVEEVCTRVAIMDCGKIIAEGTQKELMSIINDQNSVWISILEGRDRISETELKEIHGVISVEIEENTVKINNSNNINNLDRIILYFTEKGVPIKNIDNKTPNLETVFLTLTGRKLRD
ncbi:MAG: ABC transporter ATP-binding protein [Clostridiales bacterium]|jgi:ABC-2 type transport system ATP-binding protein|nr:ABC transporter ATP-binding protein [Clostridiales bacterium]